MIALETGFDPLVPRPIDRPTVLPLDEEPDPEAIDRAKIVAAPDDPAEWPRWRAKLVSWREDARRRLGAVTYPSATAWASRCFTVAIVWLWDERLFDHDGQRFEPERFVARTTADFGGLDGVVLWHAYPIIGLDGRNQFEFYRDVPGLVELVADLRRCDLRVFIDYNPWDTGTRRDPAGDETMLASLVTALGADGVFLDTMREGGSALVAELRRLDPPPVLEGESRVPLERLGDHQLSWAQWFADSAAPGVLAAHWLERRHMLHHTRRWNRDHSDELQSSWINGTGMIVWDAVFGSWVGWNERDRSTLRRMRRCQRALADVLLDGEWTPLVDAAPRALAHGVFASRFSQGSTTVWAAINRGTTDYAGVVLDPVDTDGTWFDLVSGRRLDGPDDTVVVPSRSIGGVVRVAGGLVPDEIAELVAGLADDTPASDATFPARLPVRIDAPLSSAGPPVDAVRLRRGSHQIEIRYRVRETGMYGGAPFIEEWKPLPPRLHATATERLTVTIGNVAVACVEETGADGTPLTGLSLRDAREYAASRGARLPTEFEWQLAATAPTFRRAEPLVWNWTESEHSDGITRFAVLKGGCAFAASGSDWYFDGGPQPPEFSAKLLLAGLGIERSTSIGFRLAWDVTDAS